MTKLERFQSLRQLGMVAVTLDASRPFVGVPAGLATSYKLKLNFGHLKGRGVTADDWGLRELMRFSGEWLQVAVPWAAVWCMSALDELGQAHTHAYVEDQPAGVHMYLREQPPEPQRVKAVVLRRGLN